MDAPGYVSLSQAQNQTQVYLRMASAGIEEPVSEEVVSGGTGGTQLANLLGAYYPPTSHIATNTYLL